MNSNFVEKQFFLLFYLHPNLLSINLAILEYNTIHKTRKEKIHHATTTATAIEWLLCRTRWSSLWKRYIRPRSRDLRQCCWWWWWWYSCLGTWWRSRWGSAWRGRSWCQQRHRCPGGWGTDWWTSKEAEIHGYWQFSDSFRATPQKFKWHSRERDSRFYV